VDGSALDQLPGQEMRDASDLILQFGPYKGSTLPQVAMHHREYIRQLVRSDQRPEVRAAAGRLVAALHAPAEHLAQTSARCCSPPALDDFAIVPQ
jgi:hypothetical protein